MADIPFSNVIPGCRMPFLGPRAQQATGLHGERDKRNFHRDAPSPEHADEDRVSLRGNEHQ